MPLEPDFDHIDDLDPANPFPDDPVSEGDDHLRGIKLALQGNVGGDDLTTVLKVAGIDAVLASALGLQLIVGSQFDIKQDEDDDVKYTMQNQIGGLRIQVDAVTGNIRIDQMSSVGVFERQIMEVSRNGEVGVFHPETQSRAFRTIDRQLFNSPLELLDATGLGRPAGFNALPFLSFAANYTVLAAHNGFKLRTDNVARTISVPANLPEGFCITHYKGTSSGAAVDTINATGGATFRFYNGDEVITGTARTLLQGGVCTISWVTPTVYDIWGNGGLQ